MSKVIMVLSNTGDGSAPVNLKDVTDQQLARVLAPAVLFALKEMFYTKPLSDEDRERLGPGLDYVMNSLAYKTGIGGSEDVRKRALSIAERGI